MAEVGIFRRVDAVTVPAPDLEAGLHFYGRALGHRLKWRNDAVGQAGLDLPDGDTKLVLTTRQGYQPNWLVDVVAGTAVRAHTPVLPDARPSLSDPAGSYQRPDRAAAGPGPTVAP